MWEVIKDWVFNVIQFFYNGVGDWGMAIIIITIIFRIIVAPLVHKSTTANFAMQKVQPLLQEIRRSSPTILFVSARKCSVFMQETKFNPLAGCLPMLSRCLSSSRCIRCSIAWSIGYARRQCRISSTISYLT